MDKQKAIRAVRALLVALDQDPTSDGFKDTPRRVVEMYEDLLRVEDPELDRIFEAKFDGMIIIKDIPFVSCCMHHLVFFHGRAHVSYIPWKDVLGLSKVARLVVSESKGFTIQEEMTRRIAEGLDSIGTRGVMVVIEAQHNCVSLRGIKAIGSTTITSTVRGVFRDVPAARQEFLALIGKNGKMS